MAGNRIGRPVPCRPRGPAPAHCGQPRRPASELSLIHIFDTNGSIWNPAVEELLGLADLILLDVKQADPERHLALTGRDNARTLRCV